MSFISTKNAQYAFHNREWINYRKEQLNKLLAGVAIKTLKGVETGLSVIQIEEMQAELKRLEGGS